MATAAKKTKPPQPARTKHKPYPMTEHIGVLLHEVARARRNAVDTILQPLRITRSQRWVLVYLSLQEGIGISQRDLAKKMKIGQVALGERLALLEAAGWIVRHTDKADRRSRLIYMTDLGYETLEHSREIAKSTNKAILKGIPPANVAIAESVLRDMLANIKKLDGPN